MVASRLGDNPRFLACGVYLGMDRGSLGENLEVCFITDKLQHIYQDVLLVNREESSVCTPLIKLLLPCFVGESLLLRASDWVL